MFYIIGFYHVWVLFNVFILSYYQWMVILLFLSNHIHCTGVHYKIYYKCERKLGSVDTFKCIELIFFKNIYGQLFYKLISMVFFRFSNLLVLTFVKYLFINYIIMPSCGVYIFFARLKYFKFTWISQVLKTINQCFREGDDHDNLWLIGF